MRSYQPLTLTLSPSDGERGFDMVVGIHSPVAGRRDKYEGPFNSTD
jgi:hypothetical protein